MALADLMKWVRVGARKFYYDLRMVDGNDKPLEINGVEVPTMETQGVRGVGVFVSETAPANPMVGDIWIRLL